MRSIAVTGIVLGGLALGTNVILKTPSVAIAKTKVGKRFGAGPPDLANADLLVTVTDAGVSAPISTPPTWQQNPPNAVIDRACLDYPNKWTLSGWARDPVSGVNQGSFLLNYDMKSGNVTWKNTIVDNQPPGALPNMMNTVAIKAIQLVLKRIVVPDQIN